MTPLNTIIEEEIETTVRGIDDLQKKYWFENTVTPQDEEIKILLTTAMQRAYEAGKADSAHENTPDIEWEKKIREKLSVAGSDGFAIDADIDGVIEIVTQTLSSRDTYWKERVRREFADHYWDSLEKDKDILMLHLDTLLDNLK